MSNKEGQTITESEQEIQEKKKETKEAPDVPEILAKKTEIEESVEAKTDQGKRVLQSFAELQQAYDYRNAPETPALPRVHLRLPYSWLHEI